MKMLSLIFLLSFNGAWCRAQSHEAQQLLLNYEKLLQLKSILSDMQKGYEIVSTGYNAVREISQGNFSLHDAFMAGLADVSPAVKNYRYVAEIIRNQKGILKEYKSALNQFRASDLLVHEETRYLERVYGNLFQKSLENLDELVTILTASSLSMSDDERLAAIDRIHADVEDQLHFLRKFNTSTRMLVLQRGKEQRNTEAIRKLYQYPLPDEK